jgi:UDP-3-O-[3-hydroxymyristoyl] N-acetylglucosamine deacetylase
LKKDLKKSKRIFRSISSPLTFSGIGVHSGIRTSVEIIPEGSGISFKKKGEPDSTVRVSLDNILDTTHGTTIGNKNTSYSMIEHILGTLYAYSINNITVVLDGGNEVPILDGSALELVNKLKDAGLVEKGEDNNHRDLFIKSSFEFQHQHSFLGVYPSPYQVVSYFISYKGYPQLTQMKTIRVTPQNFEKEVAPARTYALLEWVEALKQRGLIKGGSLENSLVYSEKGLLNESPLRFEDECVRHKILDFLGDLSLFGRRLIGHFVILRGGHTAHVEFLKYLKSKV